jgi:flagellar hook-associated protein 1
MDLMGNGRSALIAFQRALVTTSHNISNANTEGYTRQEVNFHARSPEYTSGSYLGSGVETGAVKRVYDAYLTDTLNYRTGAHARSQSYFDSARSIDTLFANPETGLSARLQSFFSSWEDLANNPASMASREVVMQESRSLASRVKEIDAELQGFDKTSNKKLTDSINDVNQLARNLSDINKKIKESTRREGDSAPLDLLDQRDLSINKLSKYITVQTTEQGDGTLNVYIGSGQALVIGDQVNRLALANSEFGTDEMTVSFINRDGSSMDITSALEGGHGEISGLVDFRKEMLTRARNDLGRILMSLDELNTIHQEGMTMEGEQGSALFSIGSPTFASSSYNRGEGGFVIDPFSDEPIDLNKLSYDDFLITYRDGVFNVENQRTGEASEWTPGESVGGIALHFDGVADNGDRFLIRPSRGAAQGFDFNLNHAQQLATGSYDADNPDAPWAPGDNTNAKRIVAYQDEGVLDNGNTSVSMAYGNLVGFVGAITSQVSISLDTQKVMLTHARNERDAVSGVNLDEEAANLIRYQQAYQAAAKIISTADTMFQSLLSSITR